MKSYLSESWKWQLITTPALKRLQPFCNFFALPGSATLIIFDQRMTNEWGRVFRNQRSPSSVASEMSTSLSMSSSGHIGYRWFYQPANTVTWEDQGDPLALVSKQSWWWREALRASTGRNSLCCNVAGLRKQVWSDLTLGILQVMTVCPVAAEELYVVNILGMQCFFLQQQCRKNGRVGPLCPHLLISEQPSAALQRKH